MINKQVTKIKRFAPHAWKFPVLYLYFHLLVSVPTSIMIQKKEMLQVVITLAMNMH